MDYLIANSKEIMMLCFGVGFFIMALLAARALYVSTKILNKVNDITDLTISYINKPLNLMVRAEKTATKFLKNLNK